MRTTIINWLRTRCKRTVPGDGNVSSSGAPADRPKARAASVYKSLFSSHVEFLDRLDPTGMRLFINTVRNIRHCVHRMGV
jgi:hypothetical protein